MRLLIAALLAMIACSAAAAPRADLWAFWDAADESSPQSIDHAAWQAFLDRYVRTDEAGVNRVAYREVESDDRAGLVAYLDAAATLDPRQFDRTEQLAYWINLYNALTVEAVLRNPGKDSILRMGGGFFATGPWNEELLTIAGERVTLNDIEHRILRPIWRDHRIHYALNCASLGCPNLAKTAYTRANVDSMLALREREFVNDPRAVRFDDRGRLELSSIYDWYLVDFATNEPALLRHLADRHAEEADRLRRYEGRVKYRYDWSLNGM